MVVDIAPGEQRNASGAGQTIHPRSGPRIVDPSMQFQHQVAAIAEQLSKQMDPSDPRCVIAGIEAGWWQVQIALATTHGRSPIRSVPIGRPPHRGRRWRVLDLPRQHIGIFEMLTLGGRRRVIDRLSQKPTLQDAPIQIRDVAPAKLAPAFLATQSTSRNQSAQPTVGFTIAGPDHHGRTIDRMQFRSDVIGQTRVTGRRVPSDDSGQRMAVGQSQSAVSQFGCTMDQFVGVRRAF